jgi:hypothetical protein
MQVQQRNERAYEQSGVRAPWFQRGGGGLWPYLQCSSVERTSWKSSTAIEPCVCLFRSMIVRYKV